MPNNIVHFGKVSTPGSCLLYIYYQHCNTIILPTLQMTAQYAALRSYGGLKVGTRVYYL